MIQSSNAAPRPARPASGFRQGRLRLAIAVMAAGTMAAAATGLGLAAPKAQAAESDIFTVKDVAVDATADSAYKARDQALAEGQVKAFKELMDRIVLASDRPQVPRLGPDAINELVRDFEVANEKTSAVRYLARMTVRFKRHAVRKLLRDHHIGFAETRSKPLLILPVYEVSGALSLWDDLNPWRAAWGQVPSSEGLVPLVLPLGDLQDIAMIGPEQAVRGDDKRLSAIAKRYGASDVLIARAVMRYPDSPDAKGNTGISLQVVLSRFGTVKLEQARVENFVPQAGETQAALLQRGATAIARQIEEDWKRDNRLRFGTGDELMVEVPLDSLRQWLQIRDRLGQVAFIRRSDLVFLTRRTAVLRLNYIGDEEQLRLALAQSDLTLERGKTSSVLRLGGQGKADDSETGTP